MKIEKCPFCGGEAEYRHMILNGHDLTLSEGFVRCRSCGVSTSNVVMYHKAIAAWNRRPQPEPCEISKYAEDCDKCGFCAQPENEPLTLEELRQMDGEPVYVVTLDNPLENQPYWAIEGINSNDSRHQNGVALYNRVQGDWGAFDLYGDTWLAYRRKPERSDG